MSSTRWLAAALIGVGLISQSSCGGKSSQGTDTLDEPIPGASCEGPDSRLSADGCLDCVCSEAHWACTELCAEPAGGRGGTDGSTGGSTGGNTAGDKGGSASKGGQAGVGGAADWEGTPPADLVCDLEGVIVTPSELSPTDGCRATYSCSEGKLRVECDGENDGTGTSLCDCYADGEHFWPYHDLFEGEGPDSCFNALNSCVRSWVPDTALGLQAACQGEPDKSSDNYDELALVSLLARAWLGCPENEPLLPGAAGIEFDEAGTWAVLYESNGAYKRGTSDAETGSWEMLLEAQPFVVVLVMPDGSTRQYGLSLGSSQMTLSADPPAAGTGRYLVLPDDG